MKGLRRGWPLKINLEIPLPLRQEKVQMPLALKRLDQLPFATEEVLIEINDPQVKHVTSLATSVNPFKQYDLLESDWQQPHDEMLCTPLVEAETLVNCCTLPYPDMTLSDTWESLTASQLLTMMSKAVMPQPCNFERADLYCRQCWRYVPYLANQFWHQWKYELLPTLREHHRLVSDSKEYEDG